jgi:hypothetical protein
VKTFRSSGHDPPAARSEHRPAMTLVRVARLVAPPPLVEVDAWASA